MDPGFSSLYTGLPGLFFGVVGILLGAILQWIISALVNQSQLINQRADELCDDIKALAAISSTYWKSSGRDHDAEAQMVSMFHMLDAMLRHLDTRIPGFYGSVEKQRLDLFDAATGGDFESVARQADLNRISSIHSKATFLIMGIRIARDNSAKYRLK